MKICSECKKELSFSSFHKKADAKDGHHPNCKECKKIKDAAWRAANIDRLREHDRARGKTRHRLDQRKESYRRHKDAHLARMKKWAQENKSLTREIKSRYKARNPTKVLAATRTRQARKLQAVPEWANGFFMEEAYHLARLRTQMTGFEWQVDHTVPLQSKLVCGLHCEANLEVVPAIVNQKKGNRTWPDMFL